MRKKHDLTGLALIGISAGLMLGGCQKKAPMGPGGPESPGGPPGNNKGFAAEQMSQDAQSFFNSLSPEAQQKFIQLDAQHKMMAIEMANQGCSGKNTCAGMGGCKTSSHSCAGKNACKGQGGPPVKDANKAVETQYNVQMNQRQKANGGMGGSGSSSGSSSQFSTSGTTSSH